MSFAQGSRTQTIYVAETIFGTTPASPGMIDLPLTGNSLALSKDALVSNTIRSDRQIADHRHGMKSVSGNLDFEFRFADFDAFMEGALMGAWAENVLKVGTTKKFFSVEKGFTDISRYHLYTGCMVNNFSLSVKPNAMVTGSFGIIGADLSGGAASEDASPTVVSGNDPFDSFTGAIYEGGDAASNEIAIITGIDFSLDNALVATQVVGSAVTPEISYGKSNLTGTLSAYFESAALLDKFIDETESVIQFTLTDLDSNTFTFLIPKVKYNGGDPGISGEGPIELSMPFQAIYDATETTNFKITRSA